MSMFKKIKKGDIDFDPPITPILTWEEGRAWLKQHGWRMWQHVEHTDGNVRLCASKDNCVNLSVDVDDASSDLDAIQQAIARVEEYEARG